jgi:hypothetical protein
VRPVVRIEARITGLAEFNDELVQDDADRPQGDLLFTPALTKTLLAAGTSSGISWYGLKLDGGAGSIPAVEREADARLGAGRSGRATPTGWCCGRWAPAPPWSPPTPCSACSGR